MQNFQKFRRNINVCYTHEALRRCYIHVGRGGALAESIPFDRRVVGLNPALAAPRRDLGQVLHSQSLVALQRINSDTVSTAVVGIASERLML